MWIEIDGSQMDFIYFPSGLSIAKKYSASEDRLRKVTLKLRYWGIVKGGGWVGGFFSHFITSS